MRQILAIIGLLTGLVTVGAIGFRMISGATWVDCFYMAVITITTVGYHEAVTLGPTGRIFVMIYLFCGLGVFTYTIAQAGEWIVNARVQRMLELRRMQKRIDRFSDHYIVCGAGRMGRTIASYLSERQKPFALIDFDEEALSDLCEERNWVYVSGDATLDETLVKAGIDRAASIAIVLPTDADNLYVTLSARLLNAKLQIVARATDDGAIQKLERAGADRVISPVSTGAQKMARFMLSPSVEDFLAIADNHGNGLELTDFSITEGSELAGKTLQETKLRDRGVMVIGIRRQSGELVIPPEGSVRLEVGDCLFVFGEFNSIEPILASR